MVTTRRVTYKEYAAYREEMIKSGNKPMPYIDFIREKLTS